MLQVNAFTGGPLEENCYLLRDEATGAAALIDPGFTGAALDAAVQKERVELILLTHGHFDHIGGVEAYRQQTGAQVLALRAEKDLLADAYMNLSSYFAPSHPLKLTADRWLSDGETVVLGETELHVLATPGHTSGGCCYITAQQVFAGDTLMAGSIGRTDFPTGSMAQLMQSLRALAELPEELTVYSGHGGTSTIGREKQTNLYMRSF